MLRWRAGIAMLATCVFVAVLVVAAPAAAANNKPSVPRASSITDKNPDDVTSGWNRQPHNCGWWGKICGDDFYVTTRKGATATWWLGDMQGVYTFSRTLPKHVGKDKKQATGKIAWTIWEKRTGSTRYIAVKTFRPPSQRGKLGWWGYSNRYMSLDGQVKIIAETRQSGALVGVQHVKLDHVGLLSEHRQVAKDLCLDADAMEIEEFTDGVIREGIGSRFPITGLLTGEALDRIESFQRHRDKLIRDGHCAMFDGGFLDFKSGYRTKAGAIAKASAYGESIKTSVKTYRPKRRS